MRIQITARRSQLKKWGNSESLTTSIFGDAIGPAPTHEVKKLADIKSAFDAMLNYHLADLIKETRDTYGDAGHLGFFVRHCDGRKINGFDSFSKELCDAAQVYIRDLQGPAQTAPTEEASAA